MLRRRSDVDLASSWATAHTADQHVPRDATLHSPFSDSLEINWVGQIRHRVIGRVGETRPSQHVNYLSPALVHGISFGGRTLSLQCKSLSGRLLARQGVGRSLELHRVECLVSCRAPQSRSSPRFRRWGGFW